MPKRGRARGAKKHHARRAKRSTKGRAKRVRRVKKSVSRRPAFCKAVLYNPLRERTFKLCTTDINALAVGSGASSYFSVFDPSGAQDTILDSAVHLRQPEFGTYSSLYSWYKPIYCELTYRLERDGDPTTSEIWPDVEHYTRHMYEFSFSSTLTDFETIPNVRCFNPTPEKKMWRTRIYFRQLNLAAQVDESVAGVYLTKPKWQDTASSIPYVGQIDAFRIPEGFFLNVDITYCTLFKQLKNQVP